MTNLLLVGDVGGTNTRLRLVRADDPHAHALREQTYGEAKPVSESLSDFIGQIDGPTHRVSAACLGVAGRVVNDDVRMTNRPGESITNENVARSLGIEPGRVRLVNDMVAHASSVDLCETEQLRAGHVEGEAEAIVMPGTGFGTGLRLMGPHGWIPMPSEGGHVDFGPPTKAMEALRDTARRLLHSHDRERVSWENIASGPSLPVLYAFVTGDDSMAKVPPKEVTDDLNDPAKRETAKLFLQLVGARAGNLLLGTLATRRMTFGGGILNDLYDREPDLVTLTLIDAFTACGPTALRDTLRHVPLTLLRSPDSGIIGAAAIARDLT